MSEKGGGRDPLFYILILLYVLTTFYCTYSYYFDIRDRACVRHWYTEPCKPQENQMRYRL